MELTESAGNGLTRCLVCNSTLGCETWCPKHTLALDESEADKARRMRVCQEIVTLRDRLEARDAENVELHKELRRYNNHFGCLDCGEIHTHGLCQPSETRTTGAAWFATTQAINRFHAMSREIDKLRKAVEAEEYQKTVDAEKRAQAQRDKKLGLHQVTVTDDQPERIAASESRPVEPKPVKALRPPKMRRKIPAAAL